MDLSGRWKVVEAIRLDENFKPEWASIEEILADEELEPEDKIMYSSFMEFREDGRVLSLSPIPDDLSQEELDELVENFEYELYEGYIKLAEYSWKTENGKYYFVDTHFKEEILGEEVPSLVELKIVDGVMDLTTIRIVKDE